MENGNGTTLIAPGNRVIIRLWNRWRLYILIGLGALLRLVYLGRIPNGFTNDEASKGYDAFSILKTGCDQFGYFLPVFARSFGDYNEALYRYLTLPFVALLGLNELAVRLPSALVGIVTLIVLYQLVKEMFDESTALWAVFFLAISPWHIQISRIAWRAILLPCIFTAGLWLFHKALKKERYLIASAACLALSLYTYSSGRVFVPFFVMGMILIYGQEIWRMPRKITLSAAAIFGLVFLLLFSFWITPHGMAHARWLLNKDVYVNMLNYFVYFSPKFVFFDWQKNLEHGWAAFGFLNWIELLVLPVGIVATILSRRLKTSQILILWLLLYPIPVALTSPHAALRAIQGTIIFSMLSARGVTFLMNKIASASYQTFARIGIILVASLSLIFFTYRYFIHFPNNCSEGWRYGFRDAIAWVERSSYPSVQLSGSLGTYPYIFIMFYKRVPPRICQKLLNESPEGVKQFDRYFFDSIEKNLKSKGKLLLLTKPVQVLVIPEMQDMGFVGEIVHRIKYPNGQDALWLVELNLKNKLNEKDNPLEQLKPLFQEDKIDTEVKDIAPIIK